MEGEESTNYVGRKVITPGGAGNIIYKYAVHRRARSLYFKRCLYK